MLGESKWDIFQKLPREYIPLTGRFHQTASVEQVKSWIEENSLHFPVLLKPDIGERGWMVRKVNSEKEIGDYLNSIGVDFLVQEYISLPLEVGIFYYRYPGETSGKISSITRKGLMEVVGNGRDDVRTLLLKNRRARLYLKAFEAKYPDKVAGIPAAGEKVEVEPIGNHCRGTTFFDDTHQANDRLLTVFDKLAGQFPGFHFGRFDIRCASYEALEKGENFKILELNGAGAEPGHIYQPGRSLMAGYRDVIFHLNVLCNIAIQNRRLGVPYMRFSEGLRFIRKIRAYNRQKGS